ncbi:hypothetical protein DNTS_025844 [Danionella cerebrum]|uniref:trypsin n=1 Tax=Danionella cerebrum TaxID=2873325 RepID=A0A553NA27_9TELE|nr:hypothetical protein DNTS_025844 [Danionella translucida]
MDITSMLLLASLVPRLVICGIVNGNETKPHSRPYMVSIQNTSLHHICGGSLISDEFVLTAAHCRDHGEVLTVVLGAHSLKNKKEGSIRISVKSYHPYSEKLDPQNDIMLLRLHKKVAPTNKVNFISLPIPQKKVIAGTVCSVAGWGRLWMSGPMSDRLMEANVKIMSSELCKKRWRTSHFKVNYSFKKMTCAYGCGGSCMGDSGGPLVCGRFVVGVLSFGDPCCCNSPDLPNVYAKTSEYLTWINQIIKNHSHNELQTNHSRAANMFISELLIVSLLPYLTFSASVKSGIVNGKEARPHSRPYMVSVQNRKRHTCGGFLVSDQFVLTAAHCYKKEQELTAVVGAHDHNDGSSRINVKIYHIHPGYESETLLNDIMLLQLHSKVNKSSKISWIPIPKKDMDVKAKSECSVAGWGKTSGNGKASAKLMEVNVTIENNKGCQKFWGKTYSTSRMLCTCGHGGFCQGDSGGPLVCNNVAVGVVSFYKAGNCDTPPMPNVYTKISKFLPWIRSVLNGAFGADIINGKKAEKNSMLYMASVQVNGKHSCGGFLIDPSYVLTAAHCDKSGNMSVILGTHDIRAKEAALKRHTVSKRHKHPSYKTVKAGNDIMLLKLSKKVKIGKDVKLVAIPSKVKPLKPNSKCQVAGWGKTEKANVVDNLLVTNVLSINFTICQTMWKEINVQLPDNVLCAGGFETKSGACQGDSGGPLVCGNQAVGIVSFNMGRCDYPNVPNIYTQISKYAIWIKKVIGGGG